MPSVEISLPDHVDGEIEQLVQQGEFINREQAIEELLSMGISSFSSRESSTESTEENLFTQVVDDQQDPARRTDSGDDGRSF